MAYCGLCSCASYGSHLSASPLPPGGRQLSVNADLLVIDRGLGPQVLPNPELGYRFGLGESVDIGGRLNAGSFEINTRVRVLRGVLDLAVIPGVGFGFVPVTNADTGLFNAHGLASLVGSWHPVQSWDVVFGARAGLTYAFPLTAFRGVTAGDDVFYLIGGVLGIRFPIGKRTWLFPDLNLLYPYDTGRKAWNAPTLQGGVAFVFD
jgi:hypothetical protein